MTVDFSDQIKYKDVPTISNVSKAPLKSNRLTLKPKPQLLTLDQLTNLSTEAPAFVFKSHEEPRQNQIEVDASA